jgi:hypothetical protein
VQAFIDENVMPTTGGFICKPCSKILSKFSIRRHVEEMHINVGSIYQCPLCKIETKNKSSLKMHVYKKHPDLKGIDYNRCMFR